MIASLVAGLLLAVPGSSREHSLEELRELLAGPPDRAAARRVSRVLQDCSVPDLLDALETWPPGVALRLRDAVVDAAGLRAGLVTATRTEAHASLAAELLLQSYRRRVHELAPWIQGSPAHVDRVELLQPPGLQVRLHAPEALALPVVECVQVLEDLGLFTAPVVVWPGLQSASDSAQLAGWFPAQPAEWFLYAALREDGLAAVRLWRGIWIVPRSRADLLDRAWEERKTALRRTPQALAEELRRLEGEQVSAALGELARLPEAVWAVEAAELLLRLGIPVPAAETAAGAVERAAVLSWSSRVPALPLPPEPRDGGALASRRWQRALLLSGSELPPAAPSWVQGRRDPTVARRSAEEWLSGAQPWNMAALLGLGAATLRGPEQVAAAILRGDLPYGLSHDPPLSTPVLRGALDSASSAAAEPVLVAALAQRAGVAVEPQSEPARLAARIVRGDALAPGDCPAILEAVVGRGALEQVLTAEATAAQVLLLWREALAGLERGVDPELVRQRLSALVPAIAARVTSDRLLAGQCREELGRAVQGAAPDVSPWLRSLAGDLGVLSGGARPPDWLADLGEHGWPHPR